MSDKMKKILERILTGLLVWCIVGVLVGLLNTFIERADFKNPTDGCVYRSYAQYTNPGYLLSCELLRARFEHHGILNHAERPR